jgi:uncharacterized protein (TIGR02996 family)
VAITPDALWQEVLARPGDDGALAVLADLLQAAGDPRGELIAMQMLPSDDADAFARRDRIHALLAAHARTWLGPIADVTARARFHRGLLARLELRYSWVARNRRWDQHVADPTLATVEDLLSEHGRTIVPEIYVRFATSVAMTGLRRIEVHNDAMLGALESPAQLVHVALAIDHTARSVVEGTLRAVGARDSVTSLAFPAGMFDAVLAARWCRRLTAVTVTCAVRRGLALWPRVPRDASLAIVSSPGLEPCELHYPWDHRVEIARDARDVVARVSGEWTLHPIDAIAELPADVTRVVVEHASDLVAERVRELIAPRRIAVDVRRASWHGNTPRLHDRYAADEL